MSEDVRLSATDRGSHAIAVLIEAGRRRGYEVELEYAVPGGRIDVVWLDMTTASLPGVAEPLVIAGFEVESSWRTRKHVKGDLVNLEELSPAIGVVMLLGEGSKVDALRRFAEEHADRRSQRIVVWSDAEVSFLADEPHPLAEGTVPVPLTSTFVPDPRNVDVPAAEHQGKYRGLWDWLRTRPRQRFRVSFQRVEAEASIVLPPSCRRYQAHWRSPGGSAVARAIRDAGWRVEDVDLGSRHVTFVPDR